MIFLTYLIKVVLCSTVLFGYYWLFLRNRERWEYKANNKQLIVEFAIAPAKEPMVLTFQYIESNH